MSVMGFSAGSMLAVAMAGRADEIDAAAGSAAEPEPCTVQCCVAIHGPDRIRDVFETFNESWSRLDIPFSASLARTMCASGCTRFLPVGAGGGLHKQWFPWREGWPWMKRYTESVFGQAWPEMEGKLWSCRDVLLKPLKTPVMRVVSLNDPIVSYETCIDQSLFCNVDRVVEQTAAGHCSCFLDPTLAETIRSWREGIIMRKLI